MLAASQERPAHLGLSETGRAMSCPSATPHGQAAVVPGPLAGDTGVAHGRFWNCAPAGPCYNAVCIS